MMNTPNKQKPVVRLSQFQLVAMLRNRNETEDYEQAKLMAR
jgi:hypothetical protein